MSNLLQRALLAAILWRYAYGSGDIRTVPAISALRGSTVELPCEVDKPVIAVYWYRHLSTGDEIVIQNFENTIINNGGPRFSMTPTHTLVLRNLSVADETTYSCHVALKNGNWPLESTNLTVIVLADPLHPIVDQCNTTSEGECTYTVGKLMKEFELFPIVCRVNMVRPAVRLSWTSVKGDTHSEEYARKEKPAEGGLWNVSLALKVSKYEIGRKFKCLAEGIGVNGSTEMIVLLKRYELGPGIVNLHGTAACESQSVKGFIAVIVILVIILVALVCGGLLYFMYRKAQVRSKRGSDAERNPLSDLQRKRNEVLNYKPGLHATVNQQARCLPKKIHLAVYGFAGAGSSSFIRSLIYSVSDKFPLLGTGPPKPSRAATLYTSKCHKVTPNGTILIQDTVPLEGKEGVTDVIRTMRANDICCPVIVLSGREDIGPTKEHMFTEFVAELTKEFGSDPVFVVTRQNGDEGCADDTTIKDQIVKQFLGSEDRIFFVNNILAETDDDETKNAFLDILLKLLQVADDNLVQIYNQPSLERLCDCCF